VKAHADLVVERRVDVDRAGVHRAEGAADWSAAVEPIEKRARATGSQENPDP
jgi:hypothetical protein